MDEESPRHPLIFLLLKTVVRRISQTVLVSALQNVSVLEKTAVDHFLQDYLPFSSLCPLGLRRREPPLLLWTINQKCTINHDRVCNLQEGFFHAGDFRSLPEEKRK